MKKFIYNRIRQYFAVINYILFEFFHIVQMDPQVIRSFSRPTSELSKLIDAAIQYAKVISPANTEGRKASEYQIKINWKPSIGGNSSSVEQCVWLV